MHYKLFVLNDEILWNNYILKINGLAMHDGRAGNQEQSVMNSDRTKYRNGYQINKALEEFFWKKIMSISQDKLNVNVQL